jgi:hypothetical protein
MRLQPGGRRPGGVLDYFPDTCSMPVIRSDLSGFFYLFEHDPGVSGVSIGYRCNNFNHGKSASESKYSGPLGKLASANLSKWRITESLSSLCSGSVYGYCGHEYLFELYYFLLSFFTCTPFAYYLHGL